VRNAALIAIRVSPGRAELWAPADQAQTLHNQLALQPSNKPI